MTPLYRVTVAGPLARRAADVIGARFGEMTIHAGPTRDSSTRTVLEVDLVDQSALRALLTLLWDVGHDVLSLDLLPTTASEEFTP